MRAIDSHRAGRLIVALDYPGEQQAIDMASRLDPGSCQVKVGKELFTSSGPTVVRRLIDMGFGVFLDLKFHDIPNTVAGAVLAASEMDLWMLNVHALGGLDMMRAARAALDQVHPEKRPLLIAVTLLTSMGTSDLHGLGISGSVEDQVVHLAQLAAQAGLDGAVCSAREAAALKAACGEDFATVTPGVRPAGSESGDQLRIVTPAQAIAWGSDFLVVGRPITQAKDPAAVVNDIQREIATY